MNSETVRTRYDWSCKRPSIAVVETVAAATDRKPTDVSSLYPAIDPDALDSLMIPDQGTARDHSVCLSFTLAGSEVTVSTDGHVITEVHGESHAL